MSDTWYGTISIYSILTLHPRIWNSLIHGALYIKATKKSFTGATVDQTCKQTINADAASRLTRIAAFTSSAEAQIRWMVTHSPSSLPIGHLLEMAGLNTKEDSSKELSSHRIECDLTI